MRSIGVSGQLRRWRLRYPDSLTGRSVTAPADRVAR
jgi:hypothetical protein